MTGSIGYVAYKIGKTSQNTKKEPPIESQATTDVTVKKEGGADINKNDSIIGPIQRQVVDLTKKADQPKTEEIKIASVVEASKAVDSVSTNPAAQCLSPKKKWDDFIKSITEINTKYLSLQSSYSQGTKNTPEETLAYFSYRYNLAISAKTKFLSDADSIRKMLEVMPLPPLPATPSSTMYSPVQQIKINYLNSLDQMESAYDLRLAGFKIIAEDKDGISKSDTQTAIALLSDAFKNYESSVNEFTKNKTAIIFLKSDMISEHSPIGCHFTFGTDDAIWTTTKEEQSFSQTQPSFSVNKNYTQATVGLSTNLPIEITEGGKTRTVMQLNCAGSIIDVQRSILVLVI